MNILRRNQSTTCIKLWPGSRHGLKIGSSGYMTLCWWIAVRVAYRRLLSGVPHGSVLGPLLFLIFIKDLDVNIFSPVFKFTDDTKIISTVKDSTDSTKLQADINTLYQWAGSCQMSFNISKCKVMHLGRRNVGCNISWMASCWKKSYHTKFLE